MGGVPDDPAFLQALTSAGWSPSRKVAYGKAVEHWVRHGHEPSTAAQEFVGQFDGITFWYPQSPNVGGVTSCDLDAVAATSAIYDVVVRGYESRVGERLCPVGFASSRNAILLVGVSGCVYGGFDRNLVVHGHDYLKALSRIYKRIAGSRVP
jgi:hypothetical protein